MNILKDLIQPETLLICNDGTIGVGQIYTAGNSAIRLRIITPEGKKPVSRDDAKTYTGLISLKFAEWLKRNYRVKLEEVISGFYRVKNPFESNLGIKL